MHREKSSSAELIDDLHELPEYLPLERAAGHYHIDPELLRRAVDAGAVEAGEASGQIIVAVADVVLVAAQVQTTDQNDEDELVSITEVSRRLRLSPATVSLWHRYGWLPMLATGPRNAKLVSWTRAKMLGELHRERVQSGSRLIPRDKDLLRLGLI
jgi:hypothetical protein